jgi:hypothetical protein
METNPLEMPEREREKQLLCVSVPNIRKVPRCGKGSFVAALCAAQADCMYCAHQRGRHSIIFLELAVCVSTLLKVPVGRSRPVLEARQRCSKVEPTRHI